MNGDAAADLLQVSMLVQINGVTLLGQESHVLLTCEVLPGALPCVVQHICVVLHQLHTVPCISHTECRVHCFRAIITLLQCVCR